MKSRPILFSAPMVRALLDGSKTQTRRVMKPQMVYGNVCGLFNSWYLPKGKDGGTLWPNAKEQILAMCPYGQVGDQLWVKETHWRDEEDGQILYAANPTDREIVDQNKHETGLALFNWKPSIFMPRAASRITLEITSVRVDLLQDISETDAIAEGIERSNEHPVLWKRGSLRGDQNIAKITGFPKLAYRSIWEEINGADSWAANPWVWVIEFKKVAT